MDEPKPPPPPAPNIDPQAAASAPPPPFTMNPPPITTGLSPHIAAGLCALVPLLGGAVFLVLEKHQQFVRFWAMQSVVFGGFLFLTSILLQIVALVLASIPILGWLLLIVLSLVGILVGLGGLVLWVIMIIKAFSNAEWEIPLLGKLARRLLAGEKLF